MASISSIFIEGGLAYFVIQNVMHNKQFPTKFITHI